MDMALMPLMPLQGAYGGRPQTPWDRVPAREWATFRPQTTCWIAFPLDKGPLFGLMPSQDRCPSTSRSYINRLYQPNAVAVKRQVNTLACTATLAEMKPEAS